MADSNITKRALAGALKELMEEKSFFKINVADICERCDMNRKSFYYHFKDKYDLVNWIFDTEFLTVISQQPSFAAWDLLAALCAYFYDNRGFYKKALEVTGQNSFSEHFYELLHAAFQAHLRDMIGEEQVSEFQVNFFADAIAMTVKRWILERDCMTPDELLKQLKLCIHYIVITGQDMAEA